METWIVVCSREGEGENRDNGKGSHLGFHHGLRCDGGLGRLLEWVGDPPSPGREHNGRKSPILPRPQFCAAIPQRVNGGDATGGIGIVRMQQEHKIGRFHDLNHNSSYLGWVELSLILG